MALVATISLIIGLLIDLLNVVLAIRANRVKTPSGIIVVPVAFYTMASFLGKSLTGELLYDMLLASLFHALMVFGIPWLDRRFIVSRGAPS